MVAAGFGPPTNSTGRLFAASMARDPDPAPREFFQSLVPVDVIYEHARRGVALGHFLERPREKHLQVAQTVAVHPELVRD